MPHMVLSVRSLIPFIQKSFPEKRLIPNKTLKDEWLLSINRPFYSYLLSDLAFEWQRGWRWSWFDTDLSAFVVQMHLIRIKTTWFTQQKQWGLYQNKVTFSLTAIQRPGHRTDNCEMVYYQQIIAVIMLSRACNRRLINGMMASFRSFTFFCFLYLYKL